MSLPPPQSRGELDRLLGGAGQAWHADKMKTVAPQRVEVQVDGEWLPASLAEIVKDHRMAAKRCALCHGQMVVYGAFTATGRPTVSHRRKHAGCPLLPKDYSGTSSPHPQALA